MALLVHCVAVDRELPPSNEIRRVTASFVDGGGAGVDERRFLKLASNHQVTECITRAARVATLPLSQTTLDELHRSSLITRAHRAVLLGHWQRVRDGFEESGVPIFTLKGPTWGAQLYGSPVLREYRDLDLFVDWNNRRLQRAVEMLKSLGCSIVNEVPRQSRVYGELHHVFFWFDRLHCYGELHGRSGLSMHGRFRIPAVDVIRSQEYVVWKGTAYRTLRRAHHALFVAAHGAQHLWSVLCWIADMASYFASRPDVDELGELARTHGMVGTILTAYRVAASFFDIPADILHELAPSHVHASRGADPRANAGHRSGVRRRDRMNARVAARHLVRAFWTARAAGTSYTSHFWGPQRFVDKATRTSGYRARSTLALFVPREADREMLPVPTGLSFVLWFARPVLVVIRSRRRNARRDR